MRGGYTRRRAAASLLRVVGVHVVRLAIVGHHGLHAEALHAPHEVRDVRLAQQAGTMCKDCKPAA